MTVVGGSSSPDERTRLVARFAPRTVIGPDYVPADAEVGLLLSTDVLSEGQNLQQAQAVVSYDMPWNPQRVVQRNGRVIRLLSPHDEVYLTTMLPEPGALEEMLRLETLVRAKIRAASIYGMEVEVIDGIESDLRQYAARLAGGDIELVGDVDDGLSGAFLGELLRAKLLRAQLEGELKLVETLPWGIGAAFRQTAGGSSRGKPGVFFATRTRPIDGASRGQRYWRYAETGGEVLDTDLEMLRRIDPEGGQPADVADVDLEAAWALAAASIVEEHNSRADPRAAQDAIGPAQRFALELLRDPTVILPEGAEHAADALAVERSSTVRRALNEIAAETREERISRNDGARRVVELDPRNQRNTIALARILHHAEVDFGILYEAEKTVGNDVRRVGEEGLFASLAEENIATIGFCEFQRILTTDPHTFNTLRNEYPELGASWTADAVLHHSQLLLELIESRQLVPRRRLGYRVTYHDPCALGRYNGVYEPARRVMEALGIELAEMPRNRDNSFCCGAGGGRIWMTELAPEGEQRPSESRIDEAVDLGGIDYFAVTCPKDVTMYEDAIKTSGHADDLELRELSELMLEALDLPSGKLPLGVSQ